MELGRVGLVFIIWSSSSWWYEIPVMLGARMLRLGKIDRFSLVSVVADDWSCLRIDVFIVGEYL